MENSEDFKTSFLQNFDSKERSMNFTKKEVSTLQKLVDKYKHILICKKTDATSSKQKEQAWNNIHMEFNSMGQIPRSVKQLKYKFENMKCHAKKEATKERQEMIRTGGGKPPLPPPGSEDATDWLRSVMSASIDGNASIYDDDVINFTPNEVSIHHTEKIDKIDDQVLSPIQKEPKLQNPGKFDDADIMDTSVMETQNAEPAFDCSTPHSSLKRPMAGALKKQIVKKRAGDNLVKTALREKKLCVLQDLNKLEMQKITQRMDQEKELHLLSIEHQRELHLQTMKYNEEKHRLMLIKLQLEVEILKTKVHKNSD